MLRLALSVAVAAIAAGLAAGPDLFLHDRKTGATELVVPDAQVSGPAALSDRAREVAFASLAPNLVPGDTNRRSDVFVRVRDRPEAGATPPARRPARPRAA